ncbi:MAG: hypothetical protein HKN20_08585 [Gemmatimonadetes bacterium]|nr:hypothetical protein [Gemmatimonadota bacterium]
MKLRRAKWLFVIAAGISLLFSVYLFYNGQTDEAQFVGLWVPSILALGTLFFAGRTGGRS